MFCVYCGKQIGETVKFCGRCGNSVDSTVAVKQGVSKSELLGRKVGKNIVMLIPELIVILLYIFSKARLIG